MKSKISFFNKGIFRSTVKRYWPAWALYTAFWLFALPVSLLSDVSGSDYAAVQFIGQFETMCEETSVIMALISAIIVAMGVFSFMYKSRETSMIASLPVRREAVFTSAFLAGLIPVAIINAVIVLISLLTIAGSITGECINAAAMWYGTFMLEFICFFGIAAFIATITGSLVALPIFYGIFNFLAIGIEALIRSTVEVFVYGVNVWTDPACEFLSPAVYLIDKTFVYTGNSTEVYNDMTGKVCPMLRYEGWRAAIIYAIVGVALAVCGLLIYRRRRMECTGDVVAVPKLKPVFKYGVSICSAICFGLLMYLIWDYSGTAAVLGIGGFIALVFCMAVGGGIGYFGADMLNKKSAHVFRDNWGGFFAVAAFCLVLCAVCRFDLFGIGTYVPETDKIECIDLSGSYGSIKLTEKDDIERITELHESITDSLNDVARASDDRFTPFDSENSVVDFYYVGINYQLENGKTVSRSYTLRSDRPEGEQYVELMESERMLNARCAQYDKFTAEDVDNASLNYCVGSLEYAEWYSVDITPAQMIDLYKNAIRSDIIEGNMSFGEYYTDESSEPVIWADFREDFGDDEFTDYASWTSLSFYVTPECVHTIQWFKDNFGVDISDPISGQIENPEVVY